MTAGRLFAGAIFTAMALSGWAARTPCLASPATSALPKETIVEYQTSGTTSNDLAVVLSGDGGWADLDKQLGQLLAERGTSVVGFDCRKYFWQTRNPEETARDVAAVLAGYLKDWKKDRLILIGFSFGANVLPFVLERLPDELKPRIALAVMLSPNQYANWEIHWGDWLHDEPHKSARPIAPEMAHVSGIPLFCVYGADEKDSSLCPILAKGEAEITMLPGGHHFDGNYANLADLILKKATAKN